MKKNKKIKTHGITDVIKQTQNIGDDLADKFRKRKNTIDGKVAISAYRAAIDGAKIKLTYDKLMGTTKKIKFLEK